MKNKCDIVQDLLPLYVDGCCTQSSRELVEEHLQECAACKQVFGEMTGDIPTPEEPQPEAEPVPAEPVPEEPEKKHEKTFRKGMKKIRRRWIASLIVVIILVPFVLMGIAQVTGDGLCYTNLHEFYLAHAFLGKMKAGDYEGAAKYVDRETRRGEFQERFTEEELANYEQDAIDTFVAAAKGYTEMGGLSGYRFHWGGYASAIVGGESFDGDTFYRFDFTITVGGKDYLASLEVTDNGVTNCSVYDNPMGGPQQLNAINVWEYTLWDEYEARYDNPEREAAYTAFVEQRAYESGLQVAPKE